MEEEAVDEERAARPVELTARERGSAFGRNFEVALKEATAYTRGDFTSDLGNMFKAFIGLNFQYVPYALAQAGMWRGVIGILFILLLTEHCCMLLIRVKRSLPPPPSQQQQSSSKQKQQQQHAARTAATLPWTYGDVARRVLGRSFERVVNAALVFTQFGFCVAYLIFLSQTLRELLLSPSAPVWRFVLIPLPVLLPLGMLRSVRSLAPFSNLANIALLAGFFAILTYILLNLRHQHSLPSRTPPPLSSLPIFVGEMTSALEGIALVVPIEGSMTDRTRFRFVLRCALVLMLLVLMPMGVLGWLTFGDDINAIIINNISGSAVVDVLKVALCVGILFTYPLQIAPVMHAIDKMMHGVFARHVLTHDLGAADFEIQRARRLQQQHQQNRKQQQQQQQREKGSLNADDLDALDDDDDDDDDDEFDVGDEEEEDDEEDEEERLGLVMMRRTRSAGAENVGVVLARGSTSFADAEDLVKLAGTSPQTRQRDTNVDTCLNQSAQLSSELDKATARAPAQPTQEDATAAQTHKGDGDDGDDDEKKSVGGTALDAVRRYGAVADAGVSAEAAAGFDRVDWERLYRHEKQRQRRARSVFVRDERTVAARTVVMLLTVIIATAAGEHFGGFMALVGSLGGALLAYCFPAVLHFVRFRHESSVLSKATDLAVLLFGAVVAVVGTYTSIRAIS